MKYEKFVATIILTSSCLFVSHLSYSAEANGSFGIKLEIVSACVVQSTNDVDFGKVNNRSSTQVRATDIAVKCNNNEPYNVELMPSNNSRDGQGVMHEEKSGETINYGLYQNKSGTLPWGSGADAVTKVGNNTIQKIPVYVKVDGQELDRSPGLYRDVVTIAITY